MKLVILAFFAAFLGASARADIPSELKTQIDSGLTRGTALGIVSPATIDQIITVGDVQSEDSLLEVGSISKSFAGIVAAELSNQGQLDLEAPISNYIPELKGTYAGTITAHLLGIHTARLPDGYTDSSGALVTVETTTDLIAYLKNFSPTIPAGTRSYSNLGFATLGMVIARITGKSFHENVIERIFTPLGMQSSVYITSSVAPAGLLQGYGLLLDPLPYRQFGDLECAAGGVASTLRDMLIYLKANMNPDTSPLGQAMQLSQKLGVGWDSNPGVTPIWKNGAMDAGFSSLIEFDPGKKTGVIVIANNMDALVTVDLGKELLGDKTWGYTDLPQTASFLSQISGKYLSADGTVEIAVFPVSGLYMGVQQLKPLPASGDPIGWYRNRVMTSDRITFWIDDGTGFTDKMTFQAAVGQTPAQVTYFSYEGPDANGNSEYTSTILVKE